MAVLRVKLFSQVLQLELPPTHRLLLAILNHLGELLAGELFPFERGEVVLKIKGLQELFVAFSEKENALGKKTVPPSPSALLVVVLEGLGHRVMHDVPDIWLVDPHSEGNGGNDDADLVAHPPLLNIFLFLLAYVGVVEGCPVPLPLQVTTHFLALPLRQAVDDARLVRIFVDDGGDIIVDPLGLLPDLVVEIGPVEGGLEVVAILYSKLFDYVLLYDLGDSCCQGQYRCLWKVPLQLR